MQGKLLSLCIDTHPYDDRLAECLDSVIIMENAHQLDLLVVVNSDDDTAIGLLQAYDEKYPKIIRILHRDESQPVINQCAAAALGKYLRVVGADCVVEPLGMDGLLRFLSDCDDDVVLHGCTVIDNSTGTRNSYSAPLGLLGHGAKIEDCAHLISTAPSQAMTVKTEIVLRGDGLTSGANDYAELFVAGLMQAETVGGMDADLCRFSAPVTFAQGDAEYLDGAIFRLVEMLAIYTANDRHYPAVAKCIAIRIANLAAARLRLWLALDCTPKNQDEIYAFFSKLRRANKTVFEIFSNDKYAKKLRIGRFMYPIVARFYQK